MPDHLDFLRRGLSLHSLSCEFALVADNLARLTGTTISDSITLTYKLLEALKCGQ